MIEEQANKEAKTLTHEYMKKSDNKGAASNSRVASSLSSSCNVEKFEDDKEKVFIVYKFIQTPIEAITAGM